MSDLISRSALLEKIQFRIPNDRVLTDIVDSCVKITRRIIEEAPAVDAVPVVHGQWIPKGHVTFKNKFEEVQIPTFFKCSECGTVRTGKYNYCPNCGAKMDGKETERQ